MIIDFHSHILPKADHGSGSIETSLKQLEAEAANGVDIVCATPHFYANAENVDKFLERRTRCYNGLMEAINSTAGINSGDGGASGDRDASGDSEALGNGGVPGNDDSIEKSEKKVYPKACKYPKILLGAEVLLFPNMDEMEGIELLRLEGTNYLLVEMPFTEWSNETFQTLARLSEDERFTVVLAHIERYERKDMIRAEKLDVYYQINGTILSGFFGRLRMKKYIESGRVLTFGSDIHGSSPRQVENMVKAVKRYRFESGLEQIVSCCNLK